MSSDSRPLIVHVVFRFDYGGLENGVVNLVNGLEGGRFRHAIVALTESTDFKLRLRGGVPVYALNKRPGKDPAAYWRLFKLLRKLRPFAVHTRNIGTLDCAVVAFLAGVPIRIHGEHGWDVFDPDGVNRKHRLMRRVFGRFVHVFVTVSDDLRRWLIDRVGISPRKVRRIHNGVDTERFRPAAEGELRPLPQDTFGPGTLVVGSVTRFAAIKDPLNLVEAFIRARTETGAEVAALRLLMVGDGDLRRDAVARIEAAGQQAACWLPGSRDDVPALLRSMDVYVLGSLREGISNTVLEAMASGVTVIATNTGGNPELVTEDTGTLVPVAEPEALAAAIVKYARDSDLRMRHGRRARERAVQEFSIAAMLQNYRDLYDHTLVTAGA